MTLQRRCCSGPYPATLQWVAVIRGWLSSVLLRDVGAQKHQLGIQLYDRHHWTKRNTVRRNWWALASEASTLRSEALKIDAAGSHEYQVWLNLRSPGASKLTFKAHEPKI